MIENIKNNENNTNNENTKNKLKLLDTNGKIILPYDENSWYYKIPFIFSLLVKIKLCLSIFSRKNFIPCIKFPNGVEIDFTHNKIILNNPTEIICNENLKIISKKHLILQSGKTEEKERKGYIYSIWLNSPEDEYGNPVKNSVENLNKKNKNCNCGCNCDKNDEKNKNC